MKFAVSNNSKSSKEFAVSSCLPQAEGEETCGFFKEFFEFFEVAREARRREFSTAAAVYNQFIIPKEFTFNYIRL